MTINRNRHPLNAPGDFYVVQDLCLACLAPENEAPDLIGNVKKPYYHCFFKRQPATEEEIYQACRACRVSETEAIRYAGRNPEIILRLQRMGAGDSVDYPLQES